MADPANSSKRGGARFYTWEGVEYPSVTSVLKVINKPFLVPWAAKMVAERAVSVAPQLGKMVEEDLEDTLRFLKNAHYRRSSTAANLGTQIHEYLDAQTTGAPLPEVPPEAKPYLRGAQMWLDDYKPEFTHTECTFYSKEHAYAGTADFIAWIGSEPQLVLGDYKTGKGVYPEVALQLAAYRYADFMVIDGKETDMPPIEAGAVVHVQKESYAHIPIRCDQQVFYAFRSARDLFGWEQEVSKTVMEAE